MVDSSSPPEVKLRVRKYLIAALLNAPTEAKRREILRVLRLTYYPPGARPRRSDLYDEVPWPSSVPREKRIPRKRRPPDIEPHILKERMRIAERRRRLAWLLRLRGLTYKKIAARMGTSPERVRQMVFKYSRRINSRLKARHTHFYIFRGCTVQEEER